MPAKRGDELGKQEFLMLLVAQLKNQNPMEPMNDREFIAQLAQFTSLETMQGVASSLDATQAAALIGKSIKAASATGELAEGRVQSVRLESSGAVLVLETGEVLLKDVTEVSA